MDVISLRQAGKTLGLDPKTVKGIAIGLGLDLRECPGGIYLSARDLRRLKRCVEGRARTNHPSLISQSD